MNRGIQERDVVVDAETTAPPATAEQFAFFVEGDAVAFLPFGSAEVVIQQQQKKQTRLSAVEHACRAVGRLEFGAGEESFWGTGFLLEHRQQRFIATCANVAAKMGATAIGEVPAANAAFDLAREKTPRPGLVRGGIFSHPSSSSSSVD